MAWNPGNPANDELLINFPAQCRANWEAIALGTDPALLITNAKCSPSMGLVDTKLAQITTPGKVSGSAVTLLGSVPSGAGVLPDINSPNKLKADSADTTPQYLDSLIDTLVFQISAGDLLQLKEGGVKTEKLESGAASPGNLKYYGTNSGGTKGFHTLPIKRSGVFFVKGELEAGSNQCAKIRVPVNGTITGAYAFVKNAPTGADLIIDINRNGSTIWSTQANRLKITSGSTEGSQTSFDTTSLSAGDKLTMDIDQIGSTDPGEDLTVLLEFDQT